MARTIGEVNLAAELETSAMQQRFDALFAVAARQSLASWRQTPRNAAEVLVTQGEKGIRETRGLPCVIYLGGDAATLPLGRSSLGWAAYLDEDFTLFDLIDILDRAAVFLMDWKAHQTAHAIAKDNSDSDVDSVHPAASHVVSALSNALKDLQQQGADCSHRFHIKSWVVLPGSANTAQYMRVLALLARGPIGIPSIIEHSGIEVPQLLHLLSQPQVQAVLQHSPPGTEMHTTAKTSIKTQPATSVTRQWVSKLTGWITRGGRT